jgi:hypothetical protein
MTRIVRSCLSALALAGAVVIVGDGGAHAATRSVA